MDSPSKVADNKEEWRRLNSTMVGQWTLKLKKNKNSDIELTEMTFN